MTNIFACQVLKNVQLIGKYFHDQLYELQSEFPDVIKEVRGLGLLIGIKVVPDQTLFVKKLIDNKLLTIRAAENVVRLLPPLNVNKQNIDQAIVILRKVCRTFK